jgi:hypothetical protein
MLSIDDRIKKLIGDIGLLNEREAALANDANTGTGSHFTRYFVFFLNYPPHGGVDAFSFSS